MICFSFLKISSRKNTFYGDERFAVPRASIMTTSVTYRGSDAASVYMFCLYLSITFTPLHVSSLPIYEERWPKLHSHFLGHPCPLRLRGGRNIFSFDPSTRYYELLGLRKMELPSEATIKKAYHKMALKWHPDRAPAEKKAEAEKEFKELEWL